MNTVFFILGSNIGNTKMHLSNAVKNIECEIGSVIGRSALYCTAAWGKQDQPDFLNRVIIAETQLNAEATLAGILSIEKKMGRIRTQKNDPRLIDIDILYFNKDVIKTIALTVPHPRIADRRFVLEPLAEIAPLLIHPVLQKNNKELLMECTDPLIVKKI